MYFQVVKKYGYIKKKENPGGRSLVHCSVVIVLCVINLEFQWYALDGDEYRYMKKSQSGHWTRMAFLVILCHVTHVMFCVLNVKTKCQVIYIYQLRSLILLLGRIIIWTFITLDFPYILIYNGLCNENVTEYYVVLTSTVEPV